MNASVTQRQTQYLNPFIMSILQHKQFLLLYYANSASTSGIVPPAEQENIVADHMVNPALQKQKTFRSSSCFITRISSFSITTPY